MVDSGNGNGIFSMPPLQYNDEGWGPCEISENFRDMPYQVLKHFVISRPIEKVNYLAADRILIWKKLIY